ncbi:MAG: PorV/PorQ family protein [Rhodothermales bacterium]|nr:PorV/PorQ family protein [Rhodothermales bacterium]
MYRSLISLRTLLLLIVLLAGGDPVFAQKTAKYGADFLSGGVGGRALGMGGAHIGIVRDVSASYWNPAGMDGIGYPEVAYMHAERFAGIVSFDYAAVALPISAQSTVGLTIIRSGVDDIPNTLNAWDAERNQPKPNPENFIERFSAVDNAIMLSYARRLRDGLAVGVSGKLIRRKIGDFADAWGYSFDIGAQYQNDRVFLGANLQDISTMLQSWSVNKAELAALEDFGQEIPDGGTVLVLPVLRLGAGYVAPFNASNLTLAFDLDVAFDGQQAYVLNAGDVSFHPRIGAEYLFKNVVALRAGISRMLIDDTIGGINLTPNVGAGLRLNQFSIDYGFGDFAGLTADLGFSHRIAARLVLQQPRMARPE